MGHEQLESLLTDTVMLLCKNGLQFNSRLKIDGLIGITVDSTVFLVKLNEEIFNQSGSALLCQENNSDDRLHTVSSMNQSKPFEKASKSVGSRNITSPKRNDSSSLTAQYRNVRPQKFETNVTSMECEQVDVKNSSIGDADASHDCAVICETTVKQEFVSDTTENSDNCVIDRRGDNLFQTSKELINQNKQKVIPLAVSSASYSASKMKDEHFDHNHDYDDDNNFTQISYSSVRGQSSSVSSSSHYKRNRTDTSNLYDDMRTPISIKSYNARRRFVSPNSQHIHFKRANASSSSQQTGSNAFVLSQSVHICGYPQCGKQFQHKHHLLRHQTRKHGREPMRNRRSYGNNDYYSPSQCQQSFFDADNGEENYYDDNNDGIMTSSSQHPVDGLSSTVCDSGEAIDEQYTI